MLLRSIRHPATVILAGAVSAALMELEQTPALLRAGTSAFLVFVLVGYALSLALLPLRRVNSAERVAFVLGLGLSAVMVDGFVLNVLATGINRTSWAVSLGAITTVAAAVGWYREHTASVSPGAGDAKQVEFRFRTPGISISASGKTVLASATFLALAIAVAMIGLDRQPQPGFTELWLLPGQSSGTLNVGVTNHERAPETYDLEVTADGVPMAHWKALRLADGESWTAPVVVQTGQAGVSVKATLVRASNPATIYREVSVRVGVASSPAASAMTNQTPSPLPVR